MTTIGERIRQLADEAGLSLNELAHRAKMDRAYLGRVINGTTANPGIKNTSAIARALDVTVDYLLLGVDGIAGAPPTLEELQNRYRTVALEVDLAAFDAAWKAARRELGRDGEDMEFQQALLRHYRQARDQTENRPEAKTVRSRRRLADGDA